MLDSDHNTSVFHATIKARHAKAVTKIKIGDNRCVDKSIIHDHAVHYFKDQLTSEVTKDLVGIILKLVGDTNNHMLLSIPTMEEVNYVVFDMCPNSAPGPDGLIAFFF